MHAGWVAAADAPALLVVYLHHVDARQVLLHFLAILDTLPVNHVVDVLNLVWAHARQVLLRRRTHAQDRLVDGRQLIVLVGTSRDKPLRARVAPLCASVIAKAANLGQLQLRLTVVALEAALRSLHHWDVLERLDLSTSHGRLVPPSHGRPHRHFVWPCQLGGFVAALASIKKLNGLLGALIGVDLHALVTSDPVNDTGWGSRVSMIPQASLAAEIRRWQLAVAVRVLRLILVQQPLLILVDDLY